MFMGHYGPAVWDTQRGKGEALIPLWVGFLAVQFIDIIFALLAIFGIEGEPRMVDGAPLFTIPYSHSLLTAIGWSLLGGLIYKVFRLKSGARAFWVTAMLVFSHWIMDLIVHRPDLPLWPGSRVELGFGLWNLPWFAFALEMGLLGAGLLFWQRVTTGSRGSLIALWALFIFMGALQFAFILTPGLQVQAGTFDPAAQMEGVALGVSALLTFFLLAGLISWIEKRRSPRV